MGSVATQRNPPAVPRGWSGWVVAAATLAWVITVYHLFGRAWDLSFTLTGEPLSPESQAELDAPHRLLVIVLVAFPAIIALFAALVNRKWTALAYLVIALILTCWAGSHEEARDLFDRRTEVETEKPELDQGIPISGCNG